MRKPRPTTVPEFDRLELTIRRLLETHEQLRRRADAAEARVRELEEAFRELAAGRLDPVALEAEVKVMDQRNRRLEERLAQAREVVDRMASRLRFTTEEH